jgi:hypothetical protein
LGRGVGFFCGVVFNVFPNMFPKTSFCPICFAKCCFLVTHIGEPILGLLWTKYFYIVQTPKFQKGSKRHMANQNKNKNGKQTGGPNFSQLII